MKNGGRAKARSVGLPSGRAKCRKSRCSSFNTHLRPTNHLRSLAKPSKPTRVYLYVADRSQLDTLSQRVAQANFTDVRGSTNDSVLIGPPSLEFAPYGRIPNNKRRHDARQGTIDQDSEFIEFLQSLTDPITKPKAIDPADANKGEAVTVTPLIQHLRDKKAAREKAASNKAAAKQHKQEAKTEIPNGATETKSAPSARESQSEKKTAQAIRTSEKPSKDAIRSPPRKDRSMTSPRSQHASVNTQAATPPKSDSPVKRPTGPSAGSAAARMIQRDLGIRGGRGGSLRSAREDRRSPEAKKATLAGPSLTTQGKANGPPAAPPKPTTAAAAPGTAQVQAKSPTPASAQLNNAPRASNHTQPLPHTLSKPPTGPKATTIAPTNPAPAVNTPKTPKPPQTTPFTSTATRAFLKHANPSQGITEPLLVTALTPYGKVARVEIDKRKGFAYVDFVAPEGLRAAVAASPIKVAQGSVQVLERRDRGGGGGAAMAPTAPAASQGPAVRGGRGGVGAGFRGGARGGGGAGRGRGGAFGGNGVNGNVVAPAAVAAKPAPTPATAPGIANKAEAP